MGRLKTSLCLRFVVVFCLACIFGPILSYGIGVRWPDEVPHGSLRLAIGVLVAALDQLVLHWCHKKSRERKPYMGMLKLFLHLLRFAAVFCLAWVFVPGLCRVFGALWFDEDPHGLRLLAVGVLVAALDQLVAHRWRKNSRERKP